jgi:hypothetical protein
VLGKKEYATKISSQNTAVDYSKLPLANTLHTTVVNGASNIALQDLMSANVSNRADLTGVINTPQGLEAVTNAAEVLAFGYVNDNLAKAVIFGTKTLGDVYSHTKQVCDRLQGATLLNTKIVTINNQNFVQYTLRQCNGTIEYAINFALGKSNSSNSFSVQSQWLNSHYSKEDEMYNFQVYAISPELTANVIKDVMQKASGILPITPNANTANDLPVIYMTNGIRQADKMVINIENNSSNTSGYFELIEKNNEGVKVGVVRNVPFTLQANAANTLEVSMADKYEAVVGMYVNNQKVDAIYSNDGMWGHNEDANTQVTKFVVSNTTATLNKEDYNMYRSVEIAANTTSAIAIYKQVKGDCGESKDVNGFKNINFKANFTGAKQVKVTLVKKGIINWDDQYSYTVTLDGSDEYSLALNKFASKAFTQRINANDISTVVFAILSNGNVSGTLSQARFTNADALNAATAKASINVYPNPSNGKFTATFSSSKAEDVLIKLIEVGTGKVIYTEYFKAVEGINTKKVDVSKTISGSSNVVLQMEGNTTKFEGVKLMMNK